MKKFTLAFCLFCAAASATEVYVGPRFNYSRIKFNNPHDLEGYLAGFTAGIARGFCSCFVALDLEGTWNAGPFTGRPCQRSDISEYFLELKLGTDYHYCSTCFRPYIGFGWDRFENEQDPDTARLRYRYDKLFIPIGLYMDGACFCDWSWGVQFEFRPDIYDRLELIGVRLSPQWGYAFRVQVPFKSRFCCECWSVEVMPFFDWNRFGRVQIFNSSGAVLVIPRLIRWSAGARMLFGYTF